MLRDFCRFLAAPTEQVDRGGFRVWLLFTFVNLVWSLVSQPVLVLLFAVCGVDTPVQATDPTQYPLWLVLLLPPVVEELGFRLGLVRTRGNIYVSAGVLAFVLISALGFGSLYSLDRLPVRIALALIVGGALGWLVNRCGRKIGYPVYFYTLAVLFALLHGLNYTWNDLMSWGVGLYVVCNLLLKVPSGVLYGYIRLRNGFVPAVCAHMLHNVPAFLLYFLMR